MAKDITGGLVGDNKTINTIVSVAILIFIILIVVRIYKAMQGASKVVGQGIGDQTVSIQTGVPASRIAYIRALAQQLWDKNVTNIMWLTYDYDETAFLSAINSMSNTVELGLLNDYFKQAHKKGASIKDVVRDAFDSNEIARIKSGYFTYLLST